MKLADRCKRCRRRLRTESARRAGYGPRCLDKVLGLIGLKRWQRLVKQGNQPLFENLDKTAIESN